MRSLFESKGDLLRVLRYQNAKVYPPLALYRNYELSGSVWFPSGTPGHLFQVPWNFQEQLFCYLAYQILQLVASSPQDSLFWTQVEGQFHRECLGLLRAEAWVL